MFSHRLSGIDRPRLEHKHGKFPSAQFGGRKEKKAGSRALQVDSRLMGQVNSFGSTLQQ